MTKEQLDRVFEDEDLIQLFSNIGAYNFEYTDEAAGLPGYDTDSHVGVLAQELEQNPVTEAAVQTAPDGTKMLDTKELSAIDTAVLAEVCQRLVALEQAVFGSGEQYGG